MANYLTAEEVLVLHSLVIEETGGAHGVREIELLESLIQRPKATMGGVELYAGLSMKAAVFCEALVNYHVFVDGNKRTALISLSRFLHINGRTLSATNDEFVVTMVAIADKSMAVEEIVKWIDRHST